MRYRATLIANFAIEAENIAQAKRIAKYIRAIGERYGVSRVGNSRDFIPHRIDRIDELITVRKEQ